MSFHKAENDMKDFQLPPLHMAPMAGITDSVTRQIVRDCGADIVYSEMVSSRGIYYKDKKTHTLMAFDACEHPIHIQIFGNDPDVMAHAAKVCAEYEPDWININMGCPMTKIAGNGDGGALMKDPMLASRICEAVVRATDIPVSVKFRSGWDHEHINAPEFARIMESSGAKELTIHARTVKQQYSGKADVDVARAVVEAVNVPVIYSGDIRDFESAKIAAQTGAAGLMIGRATLGDPWIFGRLKDMAAGRTAQMIDADRRLAAALLHAKRLCALKGERTGMCESRKFSAWYIKGFAEAAVLRDAVCRVTTYAQLEDLLGQYLTRTVNEEEVF
jgi:tRNA-dihydrouridine synthase B